MLRPESLNMKLRSLFDRTTKPFLPITPEHKELGGVVAEPPNPSLIPPGSVVHVNHKVSSYGRVMLSVVIHANLS